jgi:hypothetical protein
MTRYSLAAWLFVAVIVLVVAGEFIPHFPGWATGIIAWCACLLLWPRLSRNQAIVTLLLLAFGIAGMAWGMASGKAGLVRQALAQNIPLIAMLIAVSFLRPISVLRRA